MASIQVNANCEAKVLSQWLLLCGSVGKQKTLVLRDFMAFIFKISLEATSSEMALFFTVAWAIWFNRNRTVHGDTGLSAEEIVRWDNNCWRISAKQHCRQFKRINLLRWGGARQPMG